MYSNYVNLNRLFVDFAADEDVERAAWISYFQTGAAGEEWKAVLKSKYVIVLGEPGSGKTWEFMAQAEDIRRDGQYSFFIRLDVLTDEPLVRALDPADDQRYSSWLASTRDSTFFLDSVDEARLQGRQALSNALSSLIRGLGSALSRSRIVMSCRVSEWRGTSDLEDFCRRFSIPTDQKPTLAHRRQDESEAPLLRVVSLAPLDAERVRRLAEHRGVSNVSAFIDAIDHSNAWPFAGRPKDVENLSAYWLERGRLGTLSEIIEFDVQKKLLEATARPDSLSPEKLRMGAQTLAAATMFGKQLNFLVRDDAIDIAAAADALEAQSVLPSWEPNDVNSLLARAIFDEAAYGRIRFHHRNTVDYLAAKWIAGRISTGCPYAKIEEIFFANPHGRVVAVPSRAPVAAWASLGDELWSQRLRQRLISNSPSTLLTYGDPQSLPVDARRDLLNAVVEHFRDRRHVRISVDAAQLRRIAHDDLADDINRIVSDRLVSLDLRALVLRLAREGRMKACVPIAISILDPSVTGEDVELQPLAADLVRKAGSKAQIAEMLNLVRAYPSFSEMLGIALFKLYPETATTKDLGELIEKIEDIPIRSIGTIADELRTHLYEKAPQRDVVGLLETLLILAEKPPRVVHQNRELNLSKRYYWLGEPIFDVTRRLLSKATLTAHESELAVRALRLLRLCKVVDYYHGREFALQAESERHSSVRRTYAWGRVADLESRKPSQEVQALAVFDHSAVIQLSRCDADWLIDDMQHNDQPRRRKLALELAAYVWFQAGRPGSLRKRIANASRRHTELRQAFRYEFPPWWMFWYRRLRLYLNEQSWWLWQHRTRVAKEWYMHKRWRATMWMRRGLLRQAIATSWLYFIVSDREVRATTNKYGTISRKQLIEHYGEAIGSAAWDGLRRYWKSYRPELPFERAQPNAVDFRVIVGLAGLAADVQEGASFENVTKDQASNAARYATWELNGFPDWFPELVRSHPEAVRDELRLHIEHEWKASAATANVQEVLGRIAYYGSPVTDVVAADLAERLGHEDPTRPAVLNSVIGTLLRTSEAYEPLVASLAAARVRSYDFPDQKFMAWLIAWLHVDAVTALSYVDEWLRARVNEGDHFVLCMVSGLYSDRPGGERKYLRQDFLRLECLERLIPLVYRYIRPSEDLEHNDVYTPSARDHAQHLRSALVNAIANSQDPDAYSVVRKLLDDPHMAGERDWLLRLLDERAGKDAEDLPWQASDVPEFETLYESTPRSGHALFRICLSRLGDIKGLVESDDFSKRREVRLDGEESELQVWFAGKLQDYSRGRYVVIREPEVDARKKPDIRLVTPQVDPSTIEVKWAHNCSYNELKDALATQLVGTYMRSNKSRHGVLLLGNGNAARRWEIDGRSEDFNGVVSSLSRLAQNVLDNDANVDGLTVLGIAFHEPLLSIHV